MAELAPDILIQVGRFPITNTIINTLIVDAALIGSALYIKDHIKKVPGMFQNIIEYLIETYYNFIESIAGSKNTPQIFPWVMTFFIFILLANWSGLIPGVGSVGFWHGDHGETQLIPLVRALTSDANATFALAIISLCATHALAVRTTGWKEYLGRYFSLSMFGILLFVGLLEIISEFTKIVSLSFRLFGNIYAGEVVLHTVSSLFAFIAPIPFMTLELIVGLVQALVFSILTMVFMSILMTPHNADH